MPMCLKIISTPDCDKLSSRFENHTFAKQLTERARALKPPEALCRYGPGCRWLL